MRILVDKMPEEPEKCIYCQDKSTEDFDKYICMWSKSEERRCFETRDCPYFVSFKDMFENEISDYDCRKRDPYRYG